MNAIVILMVVIFLRHSLYRLRFFLHMLQQTGYKTNEFRQWKNRNLFDKVFTSEHTLFMILIFIVIYLLVDYITLTTGIITMFVFILFWFGSTSRYRPEKEKKPLVYTARLKRVGITSLIIFGTIWFYLVDFTFTGVQIRDFAGAFVNVDPYLLSFGLVLSDMLIPFFVSVAAWIMKPVEKTIQNGFKRDARKKLASLPHLKVVAITGSYGKTSTKFVIDAFLKERIRVCVTPGSYNTPMGICKVINNDLKADDQVLILEMGARYEGNIKELCDIAQPDISVITNVGISHLETFGSREAVAREKGTLARELKPGGTLILNGDDDLVREMAELRNDVKIRFVGENGDLRAEKVEVGSEGTAFDLVRVNDDGEESQRVETKLLGSHNIQNMLLAAAVASEFDIRLQTISLAASRMEPVEHRLELKKQNGLTIIDDAFNSNPVGARNAVDVLKSFSGGRKILITPGMVELGELEEEENRKWGSHIADAELDLIILVGKEQTRPIAEGIRSVSNGREINLKVVSSLFDANALLREYAKPGDVVLYENDLPDTYN
ncbi:MAG: UDP-N-acetylmuramoyl-tripeptide--D-alanyl-D-alanine ligase [Balneolaceae bacterium]|nr:UDP-N-acetylmuramoyl-tripeptide--D-alanyl-D-alanine ligase [Balneolaceae bacterium]